MAADGVRGTGVMLSQADEGLKLFKMAQGAPAEVDSEAAQLYKTQVDARIASLEAEGALLTGKDNKKMRAAKGKEVAELKGEQRYVDACKIVKGLEPKFSNFVLKAAEVPSAATPAKAESEADPAKKLREKKEAKKQESAGLSPAETKELEDLKQKIVERKGLLKEQGMSGGQQNKDAEVVAMVNRMNDLKEKQDPGSTKKEKDAKKDAKKKDTTQSGRAEGVCQVQGRVRDLQSKM